MKLKQVAWRANISEEREKYSFITKELERK
jgi:hypothetical protein